MSHSCVTGAEGATAPETLRQKGPLTRQLSEELPMTASLGTPKEQAAGFTETARESLRSRDGRGASTILCRQPTLGALWRLL